MSFRAGSVVEIARLWFRVGRWAVLPSTEADDIAVDAAGFRSIGYGIVVDPLPTVPESYPVQSWNPDEGQVTTFFFGALVYRVRTWDRDTMAVVEGMYPEATLQPAVIPPFGSSSVSAYDGDAPTPELAALFAAERYAR